MTAYNVVRFRVKPGLEDQFVQAAQSTDRDMAGLRKVAMIKTGDRAYCFIGEWDGLESIADARDQMIRNLDGFRHMLEDLGNGLGVTDPVSGDEVFGYTAD